MWILTAHINEYDQYGDYFVTCFLEKPTNKVLKKIFNTDNDNFINHLLKGGGRIKHEEEWFFLKNIKEGQIEYEPGTF